MAGRLWRSPALLIGLGCATVSVAGGAASGQKPPQSFKSGVRLVEVDVRLSDRRGGFPTDLRIEEFEVFEDGVQQQVREMLLLGIRRPSTKLPTDKAPTPHVWIFLFDDRHLQANGIRRAREAVVRHLERLPETDLVGIVYRDQLVRGRISSVGDEILAAVRQVRLPGEPADDSTSWVMNLQSERGATNSIHILQELGSHPGNLAR